MRRTLFEVTSLKLLCDLLLQLNTGQALLLRKQDWVPVALIISPFHQKCLSASLADCQVWLLGSWTAWGGWKPHEDWKNVQSQRPKKRHSHSERSRAVPELLIEKKRFLGSWELFLDSICTFLWCEWITAFM